MDQFTCCTCLTFIVEYFSIVPNQLISKIKKQSCLFHYKHFSRSLLLDCQFPFHTRLSDTIVGIQKFKKINIADDVDFIFIFQLKLFLSRNNPLLRKMTIARNMKNSREKIVSIKKDSIKLHHVHRELVAEGSRDNETFADDGDVDIGMLGRDAETKK